MLAKLAALADSLDAAGLNAEASKIDQLLKKLASNIADKDKIESDTALAPAKKLAGAAMEWVNHMTAVFNKLREDKDTAAFAKSANEIKSKLEQQVTALHQALQA